MKNELMQAKTNRRKTMLKTSHIAICKRVERIACALYPLIMFTGLAALLIIAFGEFLKTR